jgi:hypothetical protein
VCTSRRRPSRPRNKRCHFLGVHTVHTTQQTQNLVSVLLLYSDKSKVLVDKHYSPAVVELVLVGETTIRAVWGEAVDLGDGCKLCNLLVRHRGWVLVLCRVDGVGHVANQGVELGLLARGDCVDGRHFDEVDDCTKANERGRGDQERRAGRLREMESWVERDVQKNTQGAES